MSLPVPPPPQTAVPPGLWPQYSKLLADYYAALAIGDQMAMKAAVQGMQRLTSVSGQLREMLRALTPLVRPALVLAGMGWGAVTYMSGQVAAFVAGVGAFMMTPGFLIMMVAVLLIVLFLWYCINEDRKMKRAAGYASINITPQNAFSANSNAAQLYRASVSVRGLGPLEVLEGRAQWEAV